MEADESADGGHHHNKKASYMAGLREWLRQIDAEDARLAAIAGTRQQQQPVTKKPSADPSAGSVARGPQVAATTQTAPTTKGPSAEAVAAKDKGNDFFKAKDYRKAVEWYSRSIELDPMNAITVANRAMARLQLKDYAAAEADSDQAIALDPTYVKAYMRRGAARRALGKLELALEDMTMVLSLEKDNKQASQESAAIRQQIATRQKEEEKAKKEAEERKRRHEEEEQRRKVQEKKLKEDTERKRKEEDEAKRRDADKTKQHTTQEPKQATATNLTTEPAAITRAVTAGMTNTTLSSSAILSLSSSAIQVPRTPPKTMFDFERTWDNIKDDSQAFYQYFSLLEPKSYAQFFGNSMTPAIISSIISSLNKHGIESRFGHSLEVLRHLPSIRRWRIILKKEDREALKILFDRMRDLVVEGRSEGAALDDVDRVRSLYGLS